VPEVIAGDAGFEPVTFGSGVKESGLLMIPQVGESKHITEL
jgi:hypothetical protein